MLRMSGHTQPDMVVARRERKPRTGGITIRSRFGYSRYYCAQARAHGRLKHGVQGMLQVGDDIVGIF